MSLCSDDLRGPNTGHEDAEFEHTSRQQRRSPSPEQQQAPSPERQRSTSRERQPTAEPGQARQQVARPQRERSPSPAPSQARQRGTRGGAHKRARADDQLAAHQRQRQAQPGQQDRPIVGSSYRIPTPATSQDGSRRQERWRQPHRAQQGCADLQFALQQSAAALAAGTQQVAHLTQQVETANHREQRERDKRLAAEAEADKERQDRRLIQDQLAQAQRHIKRLEFALSEAKTENEDLRQREELLLEESRDLRRQLGIEEPLLS